MISGKSGQFGHSGAIVSCNDIQRKKRPTLSFAQVLVCGDECDCVKNYRAYMNKGLDALNQYFKTTRNYLIYILNALKTNVEHYSWVFRLNVSA